MGTSATDVASAGEGARFLLLLLPKVTVNQQKKKAVMPKRRLILYRFSVIFKH